MKKAIIILIIIIIIGVGGYFVMQSLSGSKVVPTQASPSPSPSTVATTTKDSSKTVIGKSVENRDIVAYHYGTGSKELLFIGGIHGGYEWNTVLVAYELMDYLKANPTAVPKNVKVTVIPVLNPDGLNKVVGTADRFTAADVPSSETVLTSGRFNAKTVDLNRNFDCDWQSSGVWQNKKVSGGTKAFSEPESQALKAYVDANSPTAVVAYYSAAGGVFASNCHNGIPTETKNLVNIYAKASGYPARQEFDYYALTGDMVNWFAKNKVPAISILLTDHTNTEWAMNKAGVEAVLKHFAQ
jgi:g-D-glutamyl-meso-diaminopimelate peptidase